MRYTEMRTRMTVKPPRRRLFPQPRRTPGSPARRHCRSPATAWLPGPGFSSQDELRPVRPSVLELLKPELILQEHQSNPRSSFLEALESRNPMAAGMRCSGKSRACSGMPPIPCCSATSASPNAGRQQPLLRGGAQAGTPDRGVFDDHRLVVMTGGGPGIMEGRQPRRP